MDDTRLRRLQEFIKPDEALLLSQPSDVTAFSGFNCLVTSEREAFLLIRKHKITLIHASFSPTSTVIVDIQLRPGCFPVQLVKHMQESASEHKLTTVYIDSENLTYEEYRWLKEKCSFLLKPQVREAIWKLKTEKNQEEIAAIASACTCTKQAVLSVQSQLRVGITEKEVATLLFLEMLRGGADATLAFPTIVAFGPHSALPHHQPTSTPLAENMPILIDVGARVNGYCADMTRTFWFGSSPSKEFLDIETIIKLSYQTTFDKLVEALQQKQPVQAKTIDAWAREVIVAAGFGTQFIHTTGHGVGLDIHEPPSLNWRNEALIEPNTIITIEPGIYLPEKFGYRYENTVVVTEQTATELSK